jgi:hypothetical protein
MLKKALLNCGLAVSFIFASSFLIQLQSQTKIVGYQCCEHMPCVNFRTLEELNNHNCAFHPALCPSASSSNSSGMGKMSSSPITNGILGGLGGLVVGSLLKDANGYYQGPAGAMIGYGIFAPLTLLLKPEKRSIGTKIFTGLTIGGSLGGAEAQIEKSARKPSSPTQPDKTLERTLEGAAAGLVGTILTGGFNKKTKGGYSYLLRKSNILSKMAFTMYGNKIGITITL